MLKKIELSNFKGIQSLSIDLDGGRNIIAGTNGTGKSTIVDAVLWCITGRVSNGLVDYEIKRRDGAGIVPDVDNEVTLHFAGFGLKRVYRTKWSTERGEKTIAGNETLYFVDRTGDGDFEKVLKSSGAKGEGYDDFVSRKLGGDKVQMLADAEFFGGAMPWKDRRKIVFEVAGEVSDSDILAMFEPEDARLIERLIYDVDPSEKKAALKKKLGGKKTERKERETELREASRNAPDVSAINKEKVLSEVSALEAIKSQKITELGLVKTDDDLLSKLATAKSALRKAEESLEEDNSKIRSLNRTAKEKAEADYSNSKGTLTAEIRHLENELAESTRQIVSATKEKTRLETELEKMREEFAKVKASAWTGQTVCPACKQDLPEGDILAQKEQFNQYRSERLKAMVEDANKIKAKIATLENAEKPDLADISAKIDAKKAELSAILKPDFQEITLKTADFSGYYVEIQKIEKQIEDSRQTLTARQAEKQAEIAEIDIRIIDLKVSLKVFDDEKRHNARIDELNGLIEALDSQMDDIEEQINLIDRFMKMKVQTMEDAIYKKFGVKFQMFRYNITNDSYSETCEVLIDCEGKEIPYGSANTGARIKTGIRLCSVLQSHYGFSLPILIDNSESVVGIEAETQTIELRVDERFNNLEVIK